MAQTTTSQMQNAMEMRWPTLAPGSANSCKAAKRNGNALADPGAGVSQQLRSCKMRWKCVGRPQRRGQPTGAKLQNRTG